MSIRTQLFTGEPILFAPARAGRPRAFTTDSDDRRCPFCPGHEEDTPPSLVEVGQPWQVRVFANKYPAVEGAEVIVESPRHQESFDELEHAEAVVRTYAERYRVHREVAAHAALFKNEGPGGGASIPHVHSQMIPLPFVPPRIAREAEAFRSGNRCPLCTAVDRHRRDGLIVQETDAFAWLTPFASSMPYQQWLVPKRHRPEFSLLDGDELLELAMFLRRATASTRRVAASYNWTFVNFPLAEGHWYVDVLPRLTAIAGFELGTGTFVEIIDPAAAARRLRGD